MTQRETIDTTYADLRPTDLVIDKSGQAWPIKEMVQAGDKVWFWLCDPVSKMKMHFMGKEPADPVKASRLPTQADEVSKLEADFPVVADTIWCSYCAAAHSVDDCPQHQGRTDEEEGARSGWAEAVAAVEEIGGTVEAEVTAAEVDAAAAATDDAPVSLPPFADMTPLEQRSHLYLLHGLYGSDVTGRAELIAIHDQAHTQHDAGTLNSRHVPHVHTAEVK